MSEANSQLFKTYDQTVDANCEREKYDLKTFKEKRNSQYNSTIVEEYNEDESFDINQQKNSSVPRLKYKSKYSDRDEANSGDWGKLKYALSYAFIDSSIPRHNSEYKNISKSPYYAQKSSIPRYNKNTDVKKGEANPKGISKQNCRVNSVTKSPMAIQVDLIQSTEESIVPDKSAIINLLESFDMKENRSETQLEEAKFLMQNSSYCKQLFCFIHALL